MRAGVRNSLITLFFSSIIIGIIYWLGIIIGEKLEQFRNWWNKNIKTKR